MDQNAINALRQETIAAQSMLIDGKAMPSANGEILEVISPIDGAPLSSIPDATQGDIDRAVGVARRSFETGIWANQPPATRKKVLHKWADLIEANALELAVLGVRDNGTEISMAYKAEPMSAAGTIRYYAEALDKVYGDIAPTTKDVLGLIHTESVGVVGAIIPWNFPLMIGSWKLGPALATGNSVVLKPAETASLSLIKMAQLAHEAGLPEGVLNVVTGNGATAGQALARSMDVDVLAFTGSGFIGGKLLEYSAQSNLKRVYLELGGKGPHIVFADSNKLDEAAKAVVSGIFRNSGQVCVAGSRLLVEKSIQKDFVAKVAELASHMKLGDPLSIDTQMGALNSDAHLTKVLSYLNKAKAANNEIVTGGNQALADTGGYYVEPTVIDNVTSDNALFCEEIFGPVLTVTPFEDEAEATALANDSDLGLASGVWTDNLSRAHRMVSAIRTGVVHVNTYGGADGTVPLGGYKQSGNGQDKSLYAFDKFTNKKTAWIKL